MDDLIAKAIDKAAKGGATFSEVRVFGFKYENISTRDGQIETCGQYNDKGYGVRVIKDKAWGFASTAVIDESTVDEITKAAIKEAEATSRVQKKPIELTEEPIIKDKFYIIKDGWAKKWIKTKMIIEGNIITESGCYGITIG